MPVAPADQQRSDDASTSIAPTTAARRPPHRAIALAGSLILIAAAIWALQPEHVQSLRVELANRLGIPALRGAAGSNVSLSKDSKVGPTDPKSPIVGELAPQFTLLDVDGRATKLSDFRGKTVVLNFWATWCIPCRQEFPELATLYDTNAARGLVVLGVDLQEDPAPVRKFAAEFNASFPIVIDSNGSVARQYQLIGPPTTFFIGPDGVLRAVQVGALTEQALPRKLEQTGFRADAVP